MFNLYTGLLKAPRRKAAASVCSIMMLCVVLLIVVSLPDMACAQSTSSTCAKNISTASITPGQDIVGAVFGTLNALLSKIGMTMYSGFVSNPVFYSIIAGTLSIYVAVYGIMLMLNLVSHSTGEVISRLLRVAAFYTLLCPLPFVALGGVSLGWVFFDQYIGRLFLGGMNQLIGDFTTAATGIPALPAIPSATPIPGIPFLDTTAISAFYGPMNIIFQPFFLIAILGMMFLKTTGMLMAGIMGWGFISFVTLMFGAMITYVRSIIGLLFLFGIAPIFIAFMLFGKTKHIFTGWLNQVVSFAITPVMLFAFLSFYAVLINSSLISMFATVDFCWTRFFSIPGTPIDIGWWRPAQFIGGQWVLVSGDWENPDGSPLDMPINMVSILFFLILSQLGTEFTKYIEQIAKNISGGIGAKIDDGGALRDMMSGGAKGALGRVGGGGRGGRGGPGGGGGSSAADQSRQNAADLASNRTA